MSRPPEAADLAFASLEATEASHALHMFRMLLDRKKRGEIYSEKELREYGLRAVERVGLAVKHAGVES